MLCIFRLFWLQYLSNKGLTELPDYIQFNKVDGNFYISHNELTTLRGCPRIVNFFGFDNNNLSETHIMKEAELLQHLHLYSSLLLTRKQSLGPQKRRL